jgi:hypothetical protein
LLAKWQNENEFFFVIDENETVDFGIMCGEEITKQEMYVWVFFP